MCTRVPTALSLYAVLSGPTWRPYYNVLLLHPFLRLSLYLYFLSGGYLLPSVPHCPALTARPRRRTPTPRETHGRPRSRLAIPMQFSTIIIGTIVIIVINAWTMTRRQQGAHLTG